MELYLIIFTSGNYRKEWVYESHKDFFISLERFFTLHLTPYHEADTIPSNAFKMIFIASGGVEDQAMRCVSAFPYPITILADGLNNSLAAALEIAACIRTKALKVRIIHGTAEYMVQQVLEHYRTFIAKRKMKGKRIGVIGSPAPWLVASHVDYLLAGQRWGVTYTDIPIEDVYKRFHQISNDDIGPEASLFASRAKACQDATPDDLLRAMRLYRALQETCREEQLDAVAVSCFSLIEELNTTGCLALSLLNDEGIPAGCEGDLQTIMTMLMAQTLTDQPAFMGNPSFVDVQRNELLLAHCSIPTRMTTDFILRDHFETGKGIAIQGLMHEEEVTLFKCGGECLDEFYVAEGYLTENTNLATCCRTQVRVRLNSPADYFLRNPLGNHHVLIQGHHAELLKAFMLQNRCKQRE